MERASSSHDLPLVIEERKEVVVPQTKLEAHDKPNSSEVRLESDILSSSTLACKD